METCLQCTVCKDGADDTTKESANKIYPSASASVAVDASGCSFFFDLQWTNSNPVDHFHFCFKLIEPIFTDALPGWKSARFSLISMSTLGTDFEEAWNHLRKYPISMIYFECLKAPKLVEGAQRSTSNWTSLNKKVFRLWRLKEMLSLNDRPRLCRKVSMQAIWPHFGEFRKTVMFL